MIVIGNNNVVTRNHITDAPGCPEDGEVGCGVGISFEGGTGNLIAHNFVTQGTQRRDPSCRLRARDLPPSITIVRRNLVRRRRRRDLGGVDRYRQSA